MEFYQLEAFVMVVANKSFSRAAENLYLSQPTVSAHVKSLEKELGLPLFDRGKNELITTPAGETLYRYARDLLDLRATTFTEIQSVQKVVEEKITVAASSVPCQYLLPKAAAAFEKQFPGVSVSLRQENSRKACEDVFNYHCPLGVVGEKIPLPRLVFQPIMTDELVVAIPRRDEYRMLTMKDSLHVSDLAGYKMLLREPGSGTRSRFEEELQKTVHSLELTDVTVYDNQETIKQAVRQGLGLTVISRYVVEDYEEFGLLVTRPLEGMNLKRDFYLVYHEKRILSPASKALLTFVQNFVTGEEKA
ncbi:MAG: selenium metabolism-associated LysR family transcriptional regulator [Bacillota bacterium]|nr:selenium metabolism-associated LysR family transcriptional regulator [Bacillota bacterium]MDW7684636.1 selenium metabolism-associated LysR family transcriptional regulator [Bacillota bacterium]